MSLSLSSLYTPLVTSGLLDTCPMLEAYVAAFSFLFWHILFFYLTRVSTVKRFRFENSFKRESSPLTSKPLFTVATASDVTAVLSLPVYLFSISLFHSVKEKTISPDSDVAPSFSRLTVELLAGIFMYDLVFFFIHLLLHRSKFLYRHVHSRHHTHEFLSVGTTVSHSLFDGILQVATNIFVQHLGLFGWGTKHPLSRLLHNVVITYMLCEIHSELDAPFSMHSLCPSICGGALRHRYHHAYTQPGFKGRKGVHYQEFFRYLDDYFGTAVTDEECRGVVYQI